jgi:hypothetical protein
MYNEENVNFTVKTKIPMKQKNKLPHFQPFNCYSPVFFMTITFSSSASTLPSTPRSSKWSIPYIFPTKTLYTFLFSPTIMPQPSHPAPELIVLISGEEKSSQRSSLCTFSHLLLMRLKQCLTSNTANTLSSNRNTELWLTAEHARTTAAVFTGSVKH